MEKKLQYYNVFETGREVLTYRKNKYIVQNNNFGRTEMVCNFKNGGVSISNLRVDSMKELI